MIRATLPAKIRLVAAGLAVFAVLLAATAVVSAGESHTRGAIPDAAFRADGTVDADQVPDFIPALDRDGNRAGWIAKDELGFMTDGADARDIPVYADDLTTVVGHMVAGRGFVAAGADPESVPTFETIVSDSAK